MKTQSRLKAIVISYAATVVRSISQIILTSLYIEKLGLDGYGFYQYVYSIASCAIILDFGISSVVNKYYIEFKEKGKRKEIENALFYCLCISLLAVMLIAAFGAIVLFNVEEIFGAMSVQKASLTQQLFAFIVLYLSSLMIQHFFEGVILSQEKYITLKIISLAQILIKCVLIVVLLFGNVGVIAIAIGDFASVFICLIFSAVYSFGTLKIKIKYHFYDKKLILSIIKLASALCVQSVILYLNTSIDKYVIGRILNDAAVSLYSIALTISLFFDEIPTVIQRLYLPQAVKLVSNSASGEELTDFIIKPGRYQFVLCGGIFGAFVLFGRDFINIWTGITSYESWLIALLLMAASIVPLCQNVGLAILTAMNKRMFRSVCLGVAAFLNLLLTIALVKKFGLLGAPIGTFISLIICNNIIMNFYYRRIGINIRRLFKEIFGKLLVVVFVTTAISSALLFIRSTSLVLFGVKCIIYVVVYAAVLWLIGLNKQEKSSIKNFLHLAEK